MGKVFRPEDLSRRRKKKLPSSLERGLEDLSPGLRETVRELIEQNYEEFKGLPFHEVIKKLREKYGLEV